MCEPRSFNEIAADIVARAPDCEALVEEWFVTLSAVRRRVVTLSDRDVNALRWSVPLLRGVEDGFGAQAGIREGEATSDVVAAIVARADMAALQQTQLREEM